MEKFIEIKKFKSAKFTASYIARLAILTAISFFLYWLGQFCKMPAIFPSFLDFQISELPAILAGFSMGPISGCLVIVLKCLLKLPLSSTLFVGELTDILLGISFVLPASIIYKVKKCKKNAIIGLAVSSLIASCIAIVINRYVSIPFYVELYFNGNFDILVGVVKPLYKEITLDTFFYWYLLAGILPFNLLRYLVVSITTFLVYKRISKILHWEGTSLKKEEKVFGEFVSKSIEDTYKIAENLAATLKGGEILLLNGDLGAGKTTFTKGLAKAIGVKDEITSPTFTILNVYEDGDFKLNHLDMYRIEDEDEIYELGIEDSFGDDSITVIEWNKLTSLSGKIINIDIKSTGEDSRIIKIEENNEVSNN